MEDRGEVQLSVPPGPPCMSCGEAACLCLVLPSHRCDCYMLPFSRACTHEYDWQDCEVWTAEVMHRASLWRRRNPGAAVLLEVNSGTYGWTAPRVFAVELGPHLPIWRRGALVNEISACPLCGDEDLVDEMDDHARCVWRVCINAELEPDSGHLEVVVHCFGEPFGDELDDDDLEKENTE